MVIPSAKNHGDKHTPKTRVLYLVEPARDSELLKLTEAMEADCF